MAQKDSGLPSTHDHRGQARIAEGNAQITAENMLVKYSMCVVDVDQVVATTEGMVSSDHTCCPGRRS